MYAILVNGEIKETTDDFSKLMALFNKYRKESAEIVQMIWESEDDE